MKLVEGPLGAYVLLVWGAVGVILLGLLRSTSLGPLMIILPPIFSFIWRSILTISPGKCAVVYGSDYERLRCGADYSWRVVSILFTHGASQALIFVIVMLGLGMEYAARYALSDPRIDQIKKTFISLDRASLARTIDVLKKRKLFILILGGLLGMVSLSYTAYQGLYHPTLADIYRLKFYFLVPILATLAYGIKCLPRNLANFTPVPPGSWGFYLIVALTPIFTAIAYVESVQITVHTFPHALLPLSLPFWILITLAIGFVLRAAVELLAPAPA